MHRFGGYQANCTFLIDRLDLLQQFGAIAAGETHQREIQRRQRLVASLMPRKNIRVATDVWERKLTETGYVLDSSGYGLAAFRVAGALGFRCASSSGTRASRAGQGARPTSATAVVII